MRRIKPIILTLSFLLVVGVALWYAFGANLNNKPLPPAQDYQNFATTSKPDNIEEQPIDTPVVPEIPEPPVVTPKPPVEQSSSINLSVPFASQAPFGDWSMPYKEACEEASIIMVDYYVRGATLSKQQMKDDIDTQVAWQEKTWGGHYDISISQLKTLGQQFYPEYSFEIISSLTAEKIRQQLRLGRPVIVPAAGRELYNPNFKDPGPLYHMLVIKGFTSDNKFITNDPGTRNGADYIYTERTLMNAIRDWDGSAPEGEKVGLVMYR